MNLPALLAHKTFAKKENPNLIKSSFTFFNVLFFGIPVVTALFGQEATSTLICVYLGTAFYGDIFGYFQVAKTKLSTKEAIVEILKVPYLYVFIAAIAIKIWGIKIPEEAASPMSLVSWVVSALGMMIVGLHLTEVDFKKIDLPYFGKLLGFRILAAVVIAALVIGGEYLFWENLESEDYLMLALLPFFPVASNISLFASYLETEEERFSLVVVLSIGISLILIPIVAQFLPN
jgi:predicted permease